jgi:hypothetical protein
VERSRRELRHLKPRQRRGFLIGGPTASSSERFSAPLELIDTTEFRHVPAYKDKALLHQKYVVERYSPGEIATQIFCSRQSVTKHLKLFGIPLREEDRGLTGAHVFGYRLKKYRAVLNKREQRAIQKMQALRHEGLSYEKIAQVLNSLGIYTKRRTTRWHAMSVRKVLLRVERSP